MTRGRGVNRRPLVVAVRAHHAVLRRVGRLKQALGDPKVEDQRIVSLIDEVVRVTILELRKAATGDRP